MSRNPVGVVGTEEDHGYAETDPTGRYGRFKEILGRGAMKTVYKAIDEVLGIEVAWNQAKLHDVLRSPEDLQRLYSEVHLLSILKHSSVVRFYTSWIDVDHKTFNFITEMFTSGTLREYRKKYKRVDILGIKSWARQILEGLVFLHSHDPPIIHRDLKCDNIFVNGHLGQVKIGDLGLAAVLRKSKTAHSVVGTPEFMAPELYDEDYNELVDVYSFGMCVLEMFTSEYPYSECANPAQIYKKVTSGKLPNSFYRIQDLEAQRFIGKCIAAASKRLSAKELLADPFLAFNEADMSHLRNLASQKPFLYPRHIEKLNLNESHTRTDMAITGKLNSDDTMFLKVQTSDKDGSTRNIYFPFDILHDTSIEVAVEMVKELEITDWEPSEIAEKIDAEIASLVPNWIQKDSSGHDTYHIHNYQEDDNDDGPHHPFHRFSSSSSSQTSFPGLITSLETTSGCDWLKVVADDLSDDNSSHSSLHSGTYSNLKDIPNDEVETDLRPKSGKEDPTTVTHKSSRFCPEENRASKQSMARKVYKHCKVLLSSERASSSKDVKLSRNRSLVDVHSQLLHRSLLEEVTKRRLFKTVGDVENIGFQSPYEIARNVRKTSATVKTTKSGKGKGMSTKRK